MFNSTSNPPRGGVWELELSHFLSLPPTCTLIHTLKHPCWPLPICFLSTSVVSRVWYGSHWLADKNIFNYPPATHILRQTYCYAQKHVYSTHEHRHTFSQFSHSFFSNPNLAFCPFHHLITSFALTVLCKCPKAEEGSVCLHIQYVRRHEYTQMWALKIHTHAKRRTRTHKPVQSCFLFGGVQAGQSMKWPVHPL